MCLSIKFIAYKSLKYLVKLELFTVTYSIDPNEWAHTASSGSDSFTMKINCSTLLMAYKQAGSGFGKAEVYVDGKLTKTFDSSVFIPMK